MKNVNIKPLETAFAEFNKLRQQREVETSRLQELNSEYEAALKTADPNDAKALGDMSVKDMQRTILPARIKACERTLERLAQELVVIAEDTERQIRVACAQERERLLDTIEAKLKPYAPDEVSARNGEVITHARQLASQTPAVQSLPTGKIGKLSLPNDIYSNNPQRFTEQLVASVEELLAIHADATTRKTFLPGWLTLKSN